jgi:hypothetical protein
LSSRVRQLQQLQQDCDDLVNAWRQECSVNRFVFGLAARTLGVMSIPRSYMHRARRAALRRAMVVHQQVETVATLARTDLQAAASGRPAPAEVEDSVVLPVAMMAATAVAMVVATVALAVPEAQDFQDGYPHLGQLRPLHREQHGEQTPDFWRSHHTSTAMRRNGVSGGCDLRATWMRAMRPSAWLWMRQRGYRSASPWQWCQRDLHLLEDLSSRCCLDW